MRQKIQKLLDEQVNPSVASHGGKINVVDYVNRVVYISMSGGCQGCASSQATLNVPSHTLESLFILMEEFHVYVCSVVDVPYDG